jgi:hypothetical protein
VEGKPLRVNREEKSRSSERTAAEGEYERVAA